MEPSDNQVVSNSEEMQCHDVSSLVEASEAGELNLIEDPTEVDVAPNNVHTMQHQAEGQQFLSLAHLSPAQQETTSHGVQELLSSQNMKLTFSSSAFTSETFDVVAKVKMNCSKNGDMRPHRNLVSSLSRFYAEICQFLPILQTTGGTVTLTIINNSAENLEQFNTFEEHDVRTPANEEHSSVSSWSCDSHVAVAGAVAEDPAAVSAVKKTGVKLKVQNVEPEILGEISMRAHDSPVDVRRDRYQATETPTTATPGGCFVDLGYRLRSPATFDLAAEFINSPQDEANKLWDLGAGTFGYVSLVQCQTTGRLLADKLIKFHSEGADEAMIMSNLRHENVISLIGCRDENDKFHIFTDWFPVTLKDLVEDRGRLSESLTIEYTRQLLEGIAYLHYERKIVHRDLKPANIFLTSQGILKIGDLGNARFIKDCVEDKHPCGTALYNAPEYMRGEAYTTACDIWSIGVVAVYMATGRTVWPQWEQPGMNQLILIYSIGNIDKTPALPDLQSEHLYDLMAQCLRVEKEDRPSALELLTHDAFRVRTDFSSQTLRRRSSSDASFNNFTVADVSSALATVNF